MAYVITNKKDGGLIKPVVKYDQGLIDIMQNEHRFDALFANPAQKFDSNETVFLKRQLTLVQAKVLEAWYPDFTAKTAFAMNTEGGAGLASIEWSLNERTGEAAIIGGNTTSYPLVGVNTVPDERPVRNLGIGWSWTYFDLQKSIRSNVPLSARLAMAAKEGTEQKLNKLYYGIAPANESYGIKGLLSDESLLITSGDIAGNELDNFNMLAATGQDNKNYLLGVIRQPRAYTKNQMAMPDTLIMPIAQADLIETQAIENANSITETTVAQYILDNTSITRIIAAPEMEAVSKAGYGDVLVCYNSSADNMEIREPAPYTTLPMQMSGFDYHIPATADTAGLFIYRKCAAIVKNVGA